MHPCDLEYRDDVTLAKRFTHIIKWTCTFKLGLQFVFRLSINPLVLPNVCIVVQVH